MTEAKIHAKWLSATGLVSIMLTVVLVGFFAKLGLWQLDRATEKSDMLSAQQAAQLQAPLNSLSAGFSQKDIYRQIKLDGTFDLSRQFLLDNRLHNRQPGYEVLTPFYFDGPESSKQSVVLVNRGWVAGNLDRTIRPPLTRFGEMSPENINLVAVLTVPSKGITLGDAIDEGDNSWPKVLQFVDYETIAGQLDVTEIIPAVVISSPEQAGNYTYNWQPVAHGPEKHYGYAFQWFAMLTAVLAIFVYLNFIKKT